jgi:hypothetical protein
LTLHFDECSQSTGNNGNTEEGSSASVPVVTRFSVCTHFPKVELIDMTQTIEQVVSATVLVTVLVAWLLFPAHFDTTRCVKFNLMYLCGVV